MEKIIKIIIEFIKKLLGIKQKEEKIEFEKIIEITNIFTKNELNFYKELKEFLKEDKVFIFTKVRIADFIKQKYGSKYNDYVKVFNKINRKHIDYIITDERGNIKLLIELDGYSHNYKNMIKSDKMKEEIFEKINVKLLRFRNGYKHNLEEIKKYII